MIQSQSLSELFRTLEEKLLHPETLQADEELNELIANDFIEFGSSGKIYDKTLVVSALKQKGKSKDSMIDFFIQELSPEVVLVTYGAVRENHLGEKSYSLRSSIWKLNDYKWQIVFHQGTSL